MRTSNAVITMRAQRLIDNTARQPEWLQQFIKDWVAILLRAETAAKKRLILFYIQHRRFSNNSAAPMIITSIRYRMRF